MNDLRVLSFIEKNISRIARPTIVGINGAITSGKTIFAHELNLHLQASGYHTQTIHIDNFHNPRHIRLMDKSPEYYLNNALDIRRIISLLSEIKCGPLNKTISMLDMGSDTYSESKTITTNMDTIVIVEGVLLYCESLIHLFDYKVFLEVSYEEILQRGVERDVPLYGESILQQYIDLFIPVQKIYETKFSPKEHSDLIVNNNDYRNPIIVERINK